VRWVLTEAAQRAKTQPPLARFYAECARRRGAQIATVAVARKLLARSFHLLNQVQATTTTTSGGGQPAGCAR
jgi:transposase